jgi:hypothetical protein
MRRPRGVGDKYCAAGPCRQVTAGVRRCRDLPEATDHPSITQRSTMDMKEVQSHVEYERARLGQRRTAR